MDIERQVQETFSNHYKSVVLIRRGSDGIGTGFIIGKTRKSYVAMTCYHVISGNPSGALKVRLPRDTKDYVAELLYEHQGYDLAIIKVNGVSGECPILQFGDLEGVAHRANVVQLGYILGSQFALNLDPSVSPGSVIPANQNGMMGSQDVVYSAAARHGASGSAVMFDDKVIGVLYSMSTNSQVAYARSSTTVHMALKNWLHPNDAAITTEKMIELVVKPLNDSELDD
ncbi:Os12g0141500 [Oryza sativa Japonica Group]|jgi:S1-C subfamily serine protease|uniref:Expressed protein n=1 Tax=Oryza sativa subsp. japonica TaxID=39947 RepID=Q2QXV9_ORYSJ|nr:uncharacterized protein LOC4351472 isoform X2 [Oryza sativa Japonica Group]ABA96431.2 expressed protein [Oryza sativa Japonica Group]KAB8116565.1 hypothetical protein EE612_057719 [Oryza sativa]BAT15848.1 Os12g0141500 [Oryza sativa Japonica Group]